jgi:phage portal protein BeeE
MPEYSLQNVYLKPAPIITNIATVQNFEIISEQFNVMRMINSGNYAYKQVAKSYNFNVYFLFGREKRLKQIKEIRRQKFFCFVPESRRD